MERILPTSTYIEATNSSNVGRSCINVAKFILAASNKDKETFFNLFQRHYKMDISGDFMAQYPAHSTGGLCTSQSETKPVAGSIAYIGGDKQTPVETPPVAASAPPTKSTKCSICQDAELDTALYPCGHAHFCGECIEACPRNDNTLLCPTCRQMVFAQHKIYI